MSLNTLVDSSTITLSNGVQLDLHLAAGAFHGIGEVRIEGVRMRDGRRPMLPEIRTPEGQELTNYRLNGTRQEGDAIVLELTADVRSGGWMEYMLHTVRNRYNTADWAAPDAPAADLVLEWVLAPVARTLRGVTYHGFRYQFRYRSESMPIYRILDRGTWEPGGTFVGREFWVRQGIAPAIWRCEDVEDVYSSEWYLPQIEQPNIFQFFPLQAAMQGFTFTASPEGTLITWATQVAHIRTLLEKKRGDRAMFHWHEHCGDLSSNFLTAPMEVLWAAGEPNRTEWINRHEAAREWLWPELHRQIGLKEERIGTYGVLEEWDLPDFERYHRTALPAFAQAGVRTIMIPNEFENNMNVWSVGNMCCTVDYKVAKSVKPETMRAFCEDAHRLGITIEMWGNTSLSSLTYILNLRRPDEPVRQVEFLPYEDSVMQSLEGARAPWVRNASGAIEADHYTPVFCVLNLREPKVVDYWHRRWRELAEQYHVRGIFVDSSFNLSADKFTWRQNDEFDRAGGATIDQTDLHQGARPSKEPRKAIESQFLAFYELMAEMQRYGYAVSTEDVGLFCVSRSGPSMEQRLPSLPLWQETYCDFDPHCDEPEAVFFKGLAYRVMWKLMWHIPTEELTWNYHGARDDRDRPTQRQIALLKAFNRLGDGMRERTVWPEEAAVEWRGGTTRQVWAFQPLTLTLEPGETAELVLSGQQVESGTFDLPALEIAVIRTA